MFLYSFSIYARLQYSTNFPKAAVAYSQVTTPYTEVISSNFHIPLNNHDTAHLTVNLLTISLSYTNYICCFTLKDKLYKDSKQ
jgi:hypothetical protein